MKIVVAPDSFKGTATAAAVATAVAEGWALERPEDHVLLAPMADGGEGTLEAFATAFPEAERVPVTVTGPAGAPVETHWLRLPDGRAVVQLAAASGLPLLGGDLRPDTASSLGFGQAISAALDSGASGLVLGIGGSASTDGGVGMFAGLGARVLGAPVIGARVLGAGVLSAETSERESDGAGGPDVRSGASLLDDVTGLDTAGLRALPPLGAVVLTDVTSPLLGPAGAAAVFGPQKGITPERIETFDDRLARWARCFPDVDPSTPGAGAAGGVGFGLLAWGATLAGGAVAVADVLGLPAMLDGADVVVTGEGRFDGQSAVGKVPTVVRGLAGPARTMLVAGAIDAPLDGWDAAASLTVIATQTTGEPDDALRDPVRFARIAGQRLARLA
ncbi:glycerate kinase [Curtobacterium sp. ISL-83]|uniref:glycerate kinase n=1 Tax=Curtobacterium sp. ISL-83 TaxID=2819145 RepID=UPI001BE86AE2|nr:glycerate kinase [Curtobacterium sp. ISL-83]MBT2502581.1 glycerate kinase [Curtobacterium sp. ISL-83]